MSHVLNILVFGGLAAVLLVVSRILYNIYLHPLRHYPGPNLWAATRLKWAHSMQSGLYHHDLHNLHTEYGPVVRVAPDELSYINAEAWKDIYNNRNILKNPVWGQQEQEKQQAVGIVSIDEAAHLRNRRALTGAFTENAVAEHAPIFMGLVELMMQKFSEAVANGQGSVVLDIVDWLNFLLFDISGALSFGETFNSVANGQAHPWVEISCGFGKGLILMASMNFFRPLNKLLRLAVPEKVAEKMQYHKELGHQKFMQRLAMEYENKVQDYVGSIMAYSEEKGEVKMPKEEIEANTTLLIFAGSETTSTALAAIINELLRKRDVLKKAEEEVRAAFDSEEDITMTSVVKLEYVTAVIQEGIRLGPPAAIGLPRITPAAGEYICGQYVPGNTFVAVNQYSAFRSPSNFSQPNAFVPERFLPDIPFSSDRLDAFEPFLLGRHKCIGQKLAWTIMRLTLASLLFKFDLNAVEDLFDFGEQKTYFFWEKRPLKIEIRLRESADP